MLIDDRRRAAMESSKESRELILGSKKLTRRLTETRARGSDNVEDKDP